jgi:hypothetical protein
MEEIEMRTEQVKVEIFKFDELSEEAKEKVLCNFRYGDYYDCNGVNQEIEDMITLKIAEYGFSYLRRRKTLSLKSLS